MPKVVFGLPLCKIPISHNDPLGHSMRFDTATAYPPDARVSVNDIIIVIIVRVKRIRRAQYERGGKGVGVCFETISAMNK